MEVRKIKRADCEDLILNVHYARRWPSITYAYGLFDEGHLEGCVTYGTPFSSTLRSGVAGADLSGNVLELNRLCLRSNKKNHASFLVSHSLRLLSLEVDAIVVSFADTDQGHSGTVYQAANFTYHGLSAKRTDWKIKGMEHLHGQTIADMVRGTPNRAAALREKFGSDFYLRPRSRKHRYIQIVGSRGFKAKAKRALLYGKQPYPKPTSLLLAV
jgi:hypothetical protein